MAKKFTKENMYDWVPNSADKKKLKELDKKAGALINEKVEILKKASSQYKNKTTSKRTPKAGKRFFKR